jgi:hypothetical protein
VAADRERIAAGPPRQVVRPVEGARIHAGDLAILDLSLAGGGHGVGWVGKTAAISLAFPIPDRSPRPDTGSMRPAYARCAAHDDHTDAWNRPSNRGPPYESPHHGIFKRIIA